MPSASHAVVLAPLYPPIAGAVPAAAIRTRGLCRALVELGYDVDVVCGMPLGTMPAALDGVAVHTTRWVDLDGVLARVLPGEYGARDQFPGRAFVSRLFPPDRYLSWIPEAAKRARRLAGPESVVLSTSAKSAHLAARAVGARRWLADLNDPWVGNPHMPAGPIGDAIHRRLERSSLGYAEHITAVTPPLRDLLAEQYGPSRVSTLMSGFEPMTTAATTPDRSGTAVVLYAGTLYEKFDLTPLYQGVAVARDAGDVTADQLRFRFVGRLNERVRRESSAHGVEEFFHVSPPVSREDVLAMMAEATALLLPLYQDDPYSLPMKFFEYVGSGRPIVAIGPAERFAAQLVADNGFGLVASGAEDARSLVVRVVADPAGLPRPTPETAAGFTWEATTRTLARILERL